MRTTDFDYVLPEALIAQYPAQKRDDSRMLVLSRDSGATEFRSFHDLGAYLKSGDLIVVNNTKVMNARLYARKESGAKIEILLLNAISDNGCCWRGFVKPAKRLKNTSQLELLDRDGRQSGQFFAVKGRSEDAVFEFDFGTSDVDTLMREYGHIPLPPYIRREDEFSDSRRYQTVFAGISGAVAAPTAGLHFSAAFIGQLKAQGIDFAEVTLHVGPGTFKPVEVEDIRDHHMHFERFCVEPSTAARINAARAKGGRILAVGTTSVRVLESCAAVDGSIRSGSGETGIFIYPPYEFKAVDMLLTNFHLPKSTLLMLVSAFAGRENVLNAYQQAIAEKMRFYSYGDCMLVK